MAQRNNGGPPFNRQWQPRNNYDQGRAYNQRGNYQANYPQPYRPNFNQFTPRRFDNNFQRNNNMYGNGNGNNFRHSQQNNWFPRNNNQNRPVANPQNNYNQNRAAPNNYPPNNNYRNNNQLQRTGYFNRNGPNQAQDNNDRAGTSRPRISNFSYAQAQVVNGIPASALVDTGASVSLIAYKFATRGIRTGGFCELKGVGGKLATKGTPKAVLEVGVGVNILEDHNWSIDLGRSNLSMGNYSVPIIIDELYSDSDDDSNEYICYDFNFDEVIVSEVDDTSEPESEPESGQVGVKEWGSKGCEEKQEHEEEGNSVGEYECEKSTELHTNENSLTESYGGMSTGELGQTTCAAFVDTRPLIITEEEREEFSTAIQQEFANVFGDIEIVPSDKLPLFEINLIPGAVPFRAKTYRLPPHYEPFV